MDKRRVIGLIAFILLLLAIFAIIYFDRRGPAPEATVSEQSGGSAAEGVATEPGAEDGPDMIAEEEPAEEDADADSATSGVSDVASETSGAEDAEAAAAVEDGAPSFDIVRVEVSGDTVIAGQAPPNATVEILDGAQVIASTKADARGEWTIILETPLAPGTHDLAVRTTSEDGTIAMLSDQRVTVSVPEKGDEDLLVVLNTPDQPTQILQISPAEEGTAEASGQKPESEETAASTEQQIALGEAASENNAGHGDGVAQQAVPASETETGEAGSASSSVAAVADGDAQSEPQEETPAVIAEQPNDGDAIAEVAPASGMVSEQEPHAVAEGTDASAETSEAPAASSATTVVVPDNEGAVTADATEDGPEKPANVAVGRQLPVASAAEPDAASPEAGTEQSAPQSPAADTSAGEAEEAQAAQSGLTSVPPSDADTTTDATSKNVADGSDEANRDGAAAGEEPVIPPAPQPKVTVSAVEAETSGRLFVAGTAATRDPVRVYIDDEMIGEAAPSPTGTWLIELMRELPEGAYTVRVDQVNREGAVIARSEVPFERQVEVAILRPAASVGSGEPKEVTGASPELETVIIKRGDNLWNIARGTWGQGVRWSTIYQANTDQIRDPDLIYPGQVFLLPKADPSWPDEGVQPEK